MELNKNSKIILLILYALVMFGSIINEMNTIMFILLFTIAPVSIYYFVKKIFPKEKE